MRLLSFIFIFLNILTLQKGIGQISGYDVINFTAEDGLPSNVCHDAVQDSLGYVWIATDRGLSRFDGYGFKNYGIKEGLGDLTCLEIYLDRHNNIWITTLGKKVYRYISLQDTIVPYEYNHLLEPYYKNSPFNFMYYLDECNDAYFGIYRTGIIKITSGGSLILPDTNIIKPNQFYSYEVDNQFFLGVSPSKFDGPKVKIRVGYIYVQATINHQGSIISNYYDLNQKVFGNARAFKYAPSDYIYCIHGHHYFFKGETLQKVKLGDEINDILKLENGTILTAQIFRKGVKLFQNNSHFVNDKYVLLIDNISASRLLRDNQQNIFITTLEDGFYYLKKKMIKPVDLGIYTQKVITKLQKKDKNSLFILLDEKTLIEKIKDQKLTKYVYTSPNNIMDFVYNQKISEIQIAGLPSLIVSENKNKKVIGFCGDRYKGVVGFLRLIPLKGGTLSLGFEYFGIYSNMNIAPDFCSDGILPKKRFISGSDYINNSYLLGALDGLFILKSNTLVKSDSIHPLFRSRINDIKTFNGKYLLGTLGYGLGIWDGDNKISTIQKSDGILTDNIEKIYTNDGQNIYLCSKVGLSKITFTSDFKYKIKNYNRHHGLPSNIVNDVLQMGDSLYIATAKGLFVLAKELKKEAAKSPIIELMTVNNHPFKMQQLPNHLKYQENNITFYYKSIDLILSGDIMYRTRLNTGEWQESKSTSINYASLEPGKYTFQVQANNKDLVWSPVVEHVFEIKKPWWQTTLFRLSGFIFIGFLGYTMYRTRIRQLQKENKIQKELIALERSALQAQMNPHFIFNCLNSIQNYIMRNDKDMAMDYLSRFAALIRQYLHASTKDLVTLDDEISMLTNYLYLEQMRFNQSFEYHFQVDKNIDPSEITLPPLLIQPFVENAILHGMTSITNGGQINIHISKKENQLQITIKDNGKGFDKNKNSGMRKSLGIAITQKRLQYINDHAEGNYAISTQSDESGTEINISVKLT